MAVLAAPAAAGIPQILEYIAERTDIPLARIYSVVTFYALFNLEPQGEHTICICRGTACHTRGSRNLLQRSAWTWAFPRKAMTARTNSASPRPIASTPSVPSRASASAFVDGEHFKEGMLNRVSAVVRAYDPCLSCSTHADGTLALRVRLLSPNGMLLDELN
jgi:hypothetical protein